MAAVCCMMALFGAFLFGRSVAVGALERMQRRAAAARMGSSAGKADGWAGWILRNGVRPLMPAAARLESIDGVRSLAETAVDELAARGSASSVRSLLSCMLAVLVVAFAVASVVSWSLLCGLVAAAALCAIVIAYVHALQDRQTAALREAVPDILQSMESCFSSGLSLPQVLEQVVGETTGSVRARFARAVNLMRTGTSTSQALEALRDPSVPELSFVAVALDVQHQSGGSIAQVLAATHDAVEGTLDLERSLRVQTAQARLSARIVSAIPFVLIALFSLISEDFLAPFFSSIAGFALFVVALIMQAAGILMVRRMLRVEVA